MTNIYRDKNNLESATYTNRGKANLVDVFLFVVLVLIVINGENLSTVIRSTIIGIYLLVVLPVLIASIGGTPGQIIRGLRCRKFEDYESNVSIGGAYYRILWVCVNAFVSLFDLSKKKKILYDELSHSICLQIKEKISEEILNDFIKRRAVFNFIFAAIIYILWVIWIENYWFFIGLAVIYDIYISKKVNWSPWKKRGVKNPAWVEWLDALIFAVVAVTLINIFLFQNYKIPTGSMEKSLLIGDHLFVSKVAFGPRIPHTPLSFPFAQNTMPLTKSKSYVEWIKLKGRRLAGLDTIENDDIVVFNFPAGDTVVLQETARSYYSIVREIAQAQLKKIDIDQQKSLKSDLDYYYDARDYMWKNDKRFTIVTRPIDRRDNYIKRCVAIPGDTLELRDGYIFINGKEQYRHENMQFNYIVSTNGSRLNPKILSKLGIYKDEIRQINQFSYLIPLIKENADKIASYPNVVNVTRYIEPKGEYDYRVFPHDPKYPWNVDNFGPLYIPQKGVTVDVSLDNISLYERIIQVYENNDLRIEDSTIYINNEPATNYTFKMGYYYMIGDNRHNSSDGRMWGYVPEDHIVGRPKFIWLSLDKDKKFLAKIRWKRLFAAAEQ